MDAADDQDSLYARAAATFGASMQRVARAVGRPARRADLLPA